MAQNPPGWRRLWPGQYWLQTTEAPRGVWVWRVWSPDKERMVACAAEGYTRPADALRGGLRFWGEHQERLEATI